MAIQKSREGFWSLVLLAAGFEKSNIKISQGWWKKWKRSLHYVCHAVLSL